MHLKTKLGLPGNLSLVSTQSKLESDTSQGWFTTQSSFDFFIFSLYERKKENHEERII